MPVRACAYPVYPTLTTLNCERSPYQFCAHRGIKKIVIALDTISLLRG